MAWGKIEKKEEPKWEHVDIPEEKQDDFSELCTKIDEAYEKYKERRLYFGNFYNLHTDQKVAEYLFAMSEMQKCMGELSSVGCDIFQGEGVDERKMTRVMGRMLFYMEVMMMSHGQDLTDAKCECEKTCEAIERLD